MAGQILNPHLLLAVPLAPLAGSMVAGLLGTRFFGNVVGRKTATVATILGVMVDGEFDGRKLDDISLLCTAAG